MQKQHASVHHSGFSLLELLLAISISAIICAGAYQLLEASANAISTVKKMQSKLQPLQDLQWSLRHDLHSIVRTTQTKARSQFSVPHPKSGNLLSLFIPGPNQTSFLLFDQAVTSYTNGANEGLARTLKRTTVSNDPAIRGRTDAFVFEGVSLLKMVMADASGHYSVDWTRSNAQSKGQEHSVSPKQLPSSLRMTVADVALGKVTLEFGVQ